MILKKESWILLKNSIFSLRYHTGSDGEFVCCGKYDKVFQFVNEIIRREKKIGEK